MADFLALRFAIPLLNPVALVFLRDLEAPSSISMAVHYG